MRLTRGGRYVCLVSARSPRGRRPVQPLLDTVQLLMDASSGEHELTNQEKPRHSHHR